MTIGGSDANTNIVLKTMGKDGSTTTPVSLSATKSLDFVNTTGSAKNITKYFGVWIAGTYGSNYRNQAKATCTVTPASVTYPVTFNPNGGTVSMASRTATYGSTYPALPDATRTGGYTFDGWYTEPVGGTKNQHLYGVTGDTTVYAHWTVKNATTSTSTSTPAQPEQTAQEYDDGPILSVLTVAGALITTLAVAAFI